MPTSSFPAKPGRNGHPHRVLRVAVEKSTAKCGLDGDDLLEEATGQGLHGSLALEEARLHEVRVGLEGRRDTVSVAPVAPHVCDSFRRAVLQS